MVDGICGAGLTCFDSKRRPIADLQNPDAFNRIIAEFLIC